MNRPGNTLSPVSLTPVSGNSVAPAPIAPALIAPALIAPPRAGGLYRCFVLSVLAVCIVNLLAACVTMAPPPPATNDRAEAVRPSGLAGQGAVGRVGPDGGPLLADRGIGGTGAPTAAFPASQMMTDRGIGGTGIVDGTGTEGGTGIVGVVTGFGSIFVNGIEIQYDDSASVDIDGSASLASALRAGQMVAIQAVGPASAPRARTISVRSIATGPIEALQAGSATLVVAGQTISVPEGTWGGNRFGVGDWVRVSGLRRTDGTILASRLDAAPAPAVLARGRVVRDGQVTRVGQLVLNASVATHVKDGEQVLVSGNYAAGRGEVNAVAPDTLFTNPADYFGPSVNRLIVQAFVQVNKGAVLVNGEKVNAGPTVANEARHDGIAIVSLERGSNGSYTAVGFSYTDFRGHTDQTSRGGDESPVGDLSLVRQQNGHALASPRFNASAGASVPGGRISTASIANEADPVNRASRPVPSGIERHAAMVPGSAMKQATRAPASAATLPTALPPDVLPSPALPPAALSTDAVPQTADTASALLAPPRAPAETSVGTTPQADHGPTTPQADDRPTTPQADDRPTPSLADHSPTVGPASNDPAPFVTDPAKRSTSSASAGVTEPVQPPVPETPRAPSIDSVRPHAPSTGDLISDKGTQPTGASAGLEKPRPPGPVVRRVPRHSGSLTAKGSIPSAPSNLLTGAVTTSVTTGAGAVDKNGPAVDTTGVKPTEDGVVRPAGP